MALVSFNTPGSKVNRELTVDFSLNHSEKKVEMNVVTPWMPRAHFSGEFLLHKDLFYSAFTTYMSIIPLVFPHFIWK